MIELTGPDSSTARWISSGANASLNVRQPLEWNDGRSAIGADRCELPIACPICELNGDARRAKSARLWFSDQRAILRNIAITKQCILEPLNIAPVKGPTRDFVLNGCSHVESDNTPVHLSIDPASSKTSTRSGSESRLHALPKTSTCRIEAGDVIQI
jgi:hypothetical protein